MRLLATILNMRGSSYVFSKPIAFEFWVYTNSPIESLVSEKIIGKEIQFC